MSEPSVSNELTISEREERFNEGFQVLMDECRIRPNPVAFLTPQGTIAAAMQLIEETPEMTDERHKLIQKQREQMKAAEKAAPSGIESAE